MDELAYRACVEEFQKIASGRDISQLLSGLAVRKGVNPASVPGIKQVGNIAAGGNRGRAAEVANSVRGFLKGPASARMTEAVPKSAPNLGSVGLNRAA